MRILALETSTESCSVALWQDGALCWRLEAEATRRHGALILDQIDAVLDEAGIRPPQLDAVAVTRGPGAFTGVRLGLGVAQGLAFALDRPILLISSLQALAQHVLTDSPTSALPAENKLQILALLDARMGEVYWAWHTHQHGLCQPGTEALSPPEQVTTPPAGCPWAALGPGLAAYPSVVQNLDEAQRVAILPQARPRAQEVALLAAAAWERGEAIAPEHAAPVYLRDQVVQV